MPITGDSAAPAGEQNNLPNAGAILPKTISLSALGLGGAILIVLGIAAAHSLLSKQKKQ
jgi:hypothetical protein